MAGHSQFKNIMHRKGAQDKKRAKMFTKAGREIIVAVKHGGPDPEFNPRLRNAIANAKAINMPNDRIQRAIDSAQGNLEGQNYEEIRYEGYGPGGVAFIIEALTDNKNRTAADVRAAFNKNGGNLGETNSVSFMFDRVGEIVYPLARADEETMLEAAIEAGAQNCEQDDTYHTITCEADDFAEVRQALVDRFGEPEKSGLNWRANTPAVIDEDQAQANLKLIELFEDMDDVQYVTTNFEVSDEVMEKLTANG
jgi:YebC/PmpR family DNA-binding regulatory protein